MHAPAIPFIPRSARPGQVVDDRYVLLERVGSGGTASVYLARDLVTRRRTALKILHPALAEDEIVVERFRREGSTLQRLQHRNIVRAYGQGASGGVHYIAMEYVPGRTLKSVIADDAPLSSSRAIALTLQVLEAVRFIQHYGIIHRDLKPQNVSIDRRGVVKLIDFGLACPCASEITDTESIVGTVEYMSPERLMGDAATKASDVYSIGIILYELVTGRLPFTGELVATVALKHLNEQPPPPGRLNGEITADLNQLIMRALEKPPAARLPDAGTFVDALRLVARRAGRPMRLVAAA